MRENTSFWGVSELKGIVLAGGRGTRLYPLTLVTNKHLLPVYNKPMVYYPISVLMLAGIREIAIVTNPEDIDQFRRLFGNGKELGLDITYIPQNAPRGLADAVYQVREYVGREKFMVILGDNIFYGHNLPKILQEAVYHVENNGGAVNFAYWVRDPERFGVVEFDDEGEPVRLVEKPRYPRSNWAVVGLYIYDETAFERIEKIEPSARGEYEITSLNEMYLEENKLSFYRLGRGFVWFDAGTYDAFLEASNFVATIEDRAGLMIACLEEIAYLNGWIDEKTLIRRAKLFKGTEYSTYLKNIVSEYVESLK